MDTPLTLRQKQSVFAKNIGLLIIWAYNNGYELTFGEAWRPPEMEAIYVKEGKSETMNSRHIVRMAVDLNGFKNGVLLQSNTDYKPLGDFWKSINPANVWGGDFKTLQDDDHFEMIP